MFQSSEGAISATFRMWDKDGNGKLSRMELSAVLRKAMPQISKEHLEAWRKWLGGAGNMWAMNKIPWLIYG